MIYLANKNLLYNKGLDSIIESELELVNIDKPLIKEGAEKLPETKNISGLDLNILKLLDLNCENTDLNFNNLSGKFTSGNPSFKDINCIGTKPESSVRLNTILEYELGLSKNKHSFREELLKITAPSKEGNSIIVYSLHGINNNLNLEETDEIIPLIDNRYFNENGEEILSDASSTDYDAPDTQVINTAHPNSNLSYSNPLIGQEGNPDMPVTYYNSYFYNSFYNTPQVNTGQTDPAFGTFSLYSENNQITNPVYPNPNLGQANLNLAGQQVNTSFNNVSFQEGFSTGLYNDQITNPDYHNTNLGQANLNLAGQQVNTSFNNASFQEGFSTGLYNDQITNPNYHNPINATNTYPLYTVNNAIGGNGPGGQVSRDVHLSNEYRIKTDTSLLLNNRELSHLLKDIIGSLLQDRGGKSLNVKFSDLKIYLNNSYYTDRNKYYSYNINNNRIRLYYYYLIDKSVLGKIDGNKFNISSKFLSVQDRLISMFKIWVEEGRAGRTVVPNQNLRNQNIDSINLNCKGFLEWLEGQQANSNMVANIAGQSYTTLPQGGYSLTLPVAVSNSTLPVAGQYYPTTPQGGYSLTLPVAGQYYPTIPQGGYSLTLPVAGHGVNPSSANTIIQGSSLTFGERNELLTFFSRLDRMRTLNSYGFTVYKLNYESKVIGRDFDQRVLDLLTKFYNNEKHKFVSTYRGKRVFGITRVYSVINALLRL